MTSPVSVEEHDGLAVVTVDAPPLNLFDEAMHLAVIGALDELERSRPRAVLFRFEGRIVTVQVSPDGTGARNPAFDVTPAHLVTGLITERGVCEASPEALAALFPERSGG